MKSFKKILCSMVVMALLVSVFPIYSFAYGIDVSGISLPYTQKDIYVGESFYLSYNIMP